MENTGREGDEGMTEEKVPAVYILASRRHGTLYVGVTSDLCSRIAAHKDGSIPGFTQKIQGEDAGLVPIPRINGRSNPAREAVEGLAARLEG